MINIKKLKKWKYSGMLTPTRTHGSVGLVKNGNDLDIWIRVNGKPKWYSINLKEVETFLSKSSKINEIILIAGSDNNSEELK
jgi:hypothetical protein